MRLIRVLIALIVVAGLKLDLACANTTTDAIQVIRKIGPEGQGNASATSAWQQLAAGDAASIVEILKGMHDASPVALNWLRAAVDTIAAREQANGRPLPVSALEAFVRQTGQHPRARRLAYELIAQADPSLAEQLIAKMLDDPSTELRRDAVAKLLQEAEANLTASKKDEAVSQYGKALRAARDVDQVEAVAKKLTELGQPVDLMDVFGWVNSWKVIGPFDSTKGVGFERVFPPEEELKLDAEYDGKTGRVRWQALTTTNQYGLVDLNAPCGALKGVAGYAYTVIQSKVARPVELRLGSKNAWKIWWNGQYLFGRDEYHRGIEIDQYRMKADLKAGRNVILLKVCQNEQMEDWTKEWEFQLRITDELGTPVTLAKE